MTGFLLNIILAVVDRGGGLLLQAKPSCQHQIGAAVPSLKPPIKGTTTVATEEGQHQCLTFHNYFANQPGKQ